MFSETLAWLDDAPPQFNEFLKLTADVRGIKVASAIAANEIDVCDLKKLLGVGIVSCTVALASETVRTIQPDMVAAVFENSEFTASDSMDLLGIILTMANKCDVAQFALSRQFLSLSRGSEWVALPPTCKETILKKTWNIPASNVTYSSEDATQLWHTVAYHQAVIDDKTRRLKLIARLWIKNIFFAVRAERLRMDDILKLAYVAVSRQQECNSITGIVAGELFAEGVPIVSVATVVYAARQASILCNEAGLDDYGINQLPLTARISKLVITNGSSFSGLRIALTHSRLDMLVAFLIQTRKDVGADIAAPRVFSSMIVSHCIDYNDDFSAMAMLFCVCCGRVDEKYTEGISGVKMVRLVKNFVLIDGNTVSEVLARAVCKHPELKTLIFSLHCSDVLRPYICTRWVAKLRQCGHAPITEKQVKISQRLRGSSTHGKDLKALACAGLLGLGASNELVELVLSHVYVCVPTYITGPLV
ncbi:MAG: hypothetical protein CMO80_25195 [Verrucomicrobiales bacterium]|nr:hypothetical protein [Verrucomicrobiales bacterium]